MNTEKSRKNGPESGETRRPDGNHLTERERAMLAAVCQWEADNQHGGRPWTREIRLAAEAAKGADGGQ